MATSPSRAMPPGQPAALPLATAALRPAEWVPRSALGLLDEGAHRLRLAPVGTLGIYYAGTLPFVLALLYFWADQARSPDAAAHSTDAALGMTLLFVAMKTAHAVFIARLHAQLRRQTAVRWSSARLGRLALVQTVIQGPGLFVLNASTVVTFLPAPGPLVFLASLALTFPLGWVYAFFQNATVFGDGETGRTRTVLARAFRAALRHPRQNHTGLSVLTLLGLFVWINLVFAVVGLPYLLRMFTGDENVFTRSGVHLFNTTFFAVTFGLVYLALDPLAKTFYLLRCFYADSLHTGADLKSDLAALPPVVASAATVDTVRSPVAPAALALLGALVLGLSLQPAARAGITTDSPSAPTSPPGTVQARATLPATPAVSAPELSHSIDDVLRRPEFAWRAPRSPDAKTPPSGWLQDRWQAIKAWFARLRERWRDTQDAPKPVRPPGHTGPGWLGVFTLRALVWTLVIALVGLLGWLGWRQWRLRRTSASLAGDPTPGFAAAPDLTDDTLLADQLPEDEWLRLGTDLLARGERRLALRAFYLSVLSGLGARELLAIARHKSNRDYLLELRRRARGSAGLQNAFARLVSGFERVWYGTHPADDTLLAAFQADRALALGEG